MIKKYLTIAMVSAFSIAFSMTAWAEGWKKNDIGWWYERADSSYPVNEWLLDPADNKWYHFDANGYMQTGWILDGDKYYFLDNESGAMWAATVTPDGWTVDQSGAWIVNIPKKTYYTTKKYKANSGNDDFDAGWSGSDEGNGGNNSHSEHAGGHNSSSGSGSSGNNNWSDNSDNSVEGINIAYAEQVVDIVNAEREKRGKAPLIVNDVLTECAEIRAEELIHKYSHTRPDGSRCFTVLEGMYQYATAGENIAMGQVNPEYVMKAWMNSKGHRENILNTDFEEIGVGCYYHNGIFHWVQLFGRQFY